MYPYDFTGDGLPRKGYKNITVPDELHSRIQRVAETMGLSTPDLIRKYLGDQESEHPVPEGAGKRESKLTPEDYKELLLSIADGLKKSAEDRVIGHMTLDMENKITPTYEPGVREPVSIKSKGFRYVIDVDYLKPEESANTVLEVEVVADDAIKPGEALLVSPGAVDEEGEVDPDKVAKIENIEEKENV